MHLAARPFVLVVHRHESGACDRLPIVSGDAIASTTIGSRPSLRGSKSEAVGSNRER
jgi:hypothetical protein